MTSKNRSESFVQKFKEFAGENGVEFQEYETEFGSSEKTYTCYFQEEEHGERDCIVLEVDRHGELSAEIYNPVGSLSVVMKPTGTVRDISGKGKQNQEEISVHPVAKLETRTGPQVWASSGDTHLALHSFDIDGTRGADHQVADIEYVVSVE